MATNPFIRTDQSIGMETKARQREFERHARIYSNTGRSAQNVVAKVNKYKASQGSMGVVHRFPEDTPKYYMRMQIGEYGRSNPLQVILTPSTEIILPLPQEIVDKNEVDYDETELGFLFGGIWNNGGQIASSLAGGAKSMLDTGIGEIGKALGATPEGIDEFFGVNQGNDNANIQGLLGGAMAQQLGGPVADKLIGGPLGNAARLLGLSPNQWLTVLLKGPKYKRYSYTWKLVPKNASEARVIHEIVKNIQDAKCPELGPGGWVFKFPSIFQLQYMAGSKEHKYLFKFKPAVIETCDVRYMNSFYHGQNGENPPESIVLTCSFLELEFWLKGDYQK